MFNPAHPGEIVREDCLAPLALSVTAAAKWLGVSRQSLSELLNGHAGVSAEMAIRQEIGLQNQGQEIPAIRARGRLMPKRW
jgi:addiction module HigA family antidote